MASSYADRLKARRGGGIQKKKPKELKLNATKRVRGKLVYWNPYTKSWSKTKVVKKVEVKKEKPLTRAEKLKKDGFADLRGGKTKKKSEVKNNKTEVKKTETSKTEVKKTDTPKTEVKKESPQTTLKIKPKKMHAIEKRNRKRFGDAHVDKLKKQYADFKAKRKKKKK